MGLFPNKLTDSSPEGRRGGEGVTSPARGRRPVLWVEAPPSPNILPGSARDGRVGTTVRPLLPVTGME